MNFGLITEGVSEQNIIIPIVERYLMNCSASCNPYFPKTLKGKQSETGGWHKVLEICSSDVIENILIENDFLIIQIDTDQSQTSPFNVSHRLIGSDGIEIDKPLESLHKEVVEVLQQRIPTDVWSRYCNKIVFAICIHSIECWLLPAVFSDENRSAVNKCLDKLNRGIQRKLNIRPITDKNSVQSKKTYDAVLRLYKKKKDLKDASQFNHGFKTFIDSLDLIESRKAN